MEISDFAAQYWKQMFQDQHSNLERTDPEFFARFANFALDEVVNQDDLDGETRFLAILASLIGCQGFALFHRVIPAAMRFGVSPVALKELIYQATAYLGLGRTLPFLETANATLEELGVALPLNGQETTTMENRLTAGNQAQVDIFGEQMRGFQDTGPAESRHINRWLADNCFGDYYTRHGLDYRQREMITFCFLAAQGGCEAQLVSHAKANLRIGNDKGFLIKVISQCLPYIGYPRSLNALRCLEEAAQEA